MRDSFRRGVQVIGPSATVPGAVDVRTEDGRVIALDPASANTLAASAPASKLPAAQVAAPAPAAAKAPTEQKLPAVAPPVPAAPPPSAPSRVTDADVERMARERGLRPEYVFDVLYGPRPGREPIETTGHDETVGTSELLSELSQLREGRGDGS